MNRRILIAISAFVIVGVAAWYGTADTPSTKDQAAWQEVAPGILRTKVQPYGYALVADGNALLIDCPVAADGLAAHGIKKVERVLLTHHHRDSVAGAATLIRASIPVRAAKASAEFLLPAGVKKHWVDSLPLRNSRTSYFVVAEGIDGIDCSLQDGDKIEWRGRTIEVVATPGHARDHLAFIVSRGQAERFAFCGDALAAPGKLWTPYTTDWDHWTDAGLKPTHESLRKLAALKPAALYPAHGEPITRDVVGALETTAKAVEEVGFLKSFERFSKRVGDVPSYKFLVPKEQIASGGDKPWAKVSEHLFITGNTYVLVSKTDRAFMVMDPWGQRSIDQIAKLKETEKLGKCELVMFSHAHYDHYDGVYGLPGKEDYKVWALDRVAAPLAEPHRWRAPFLDARPIQFDKTFKEGEAATWREYRFKFHHFPGQTEYTMAVETNIDDKRCLFTADNFFHQDQFSGSGGWMGLNRSYPLPYAASAQKVLDIAPEWVLAEHGGPYVFNAEDYRRRVKWGEAAARAADSICVSGQHRRDWDPHRIAVEPVLYKAKPGLILKGILRVSNPTGKAEKLNIRLEGRGLTPDRKWELEVGPGKTESREIEFQLVDKLAAGRHVFLLRNGDPFGAETVDAFLAVDVE